MRVVQTARVQVDGLAFDNVTMDEAVRAIVHAVGMRDRARYACTVNLDHLAMAAENPAFRDVILEADFVFADGAPVVWLSRLLGQPLKERVTGSDLFWELGRASADRGFTLFLLGGSPGSANAAHIALQGRYPGARIAGTYCPPRSSFDTAEEQARITERIHRARPDLLLVAFGAPKQELWIAAHRERLGVPVSIGVGGSFEMASGRVRRAPLWVQRGGLEWAYRFSQEPERLFERYILRDVPYLGRATWRALQERLSSRERR